MGSNETSATVDVFLLDTSAIRGCSSPRLCKRANRGDLWVSATTGWELLHHLDKPGKFDLFKAELLKLSGLQIFNGGELDFYAAAGAATPNLGQEGRIIHGAIHKLAESNSLREFRSKTFKVDGQDRKLSDSPRLCRSMTDPATERYVQYSQNVIALLRAGAIATDNDDALHNAALDIVRAFEMHAEQEGAQTDGLADLAQSQRYMYSAYVVERAVWYLNRNGTSAARNDYEDAEICKPMHLDRPITLVTGDKGTFSALKAALTRLGRLGILARCSVIDRQQFIDDELQC